MLWKVSVKFRGFESLTFRKKKKQGDALFFLFTDICRTLHL